MGKQELDGVPENCVDADGSTYRRRMLLRGVGVCIKAAYCWRSGDCIAPHSMGMLVTAAC